MMTSCTLCPHHCKANRAQEQTGFCRAGSVPRVFRFGPHFGEEPPLTGKTGSGTVFFSRCTMKCLYCQNSPWSWKGEGRDMSIPGLTDIFRTLAEKHKCVNWNLVSPTPYLPMIREAVKPLFDEGVRLPFVYNSSGYEKAATLDEYRELCDIALVDLRYANDKTAIEVSSAPNYVESSREAVKYLWERLGKLNGGELATRGVICRILVLPGHHEEAIENLAWLATEVSRDIHISVMSQYAPAFRAMEISPWDRTVTEDEYAEVTEAAADFGFENGWIQGFESHDTSSDLVGENMTAGEGVVK